MTKIISWVFFLLTVNYSYAENELSFDQKIKNSDVIFIGKLIDRYEQLESIMLSEGDSKNMVFTTHIFNIEEVLKGHVTDKNISVKLRGGYDKELNIGSKYNKFTYSYYKNPKETALLFLSYDKLNNFYYSSQDNKTAFLIHGSIEVITDTDWVPIFASTNKENPEQDTVTLDILKNKLGAHNE